MLFLTDWPPFKGFLRLRHFKVIFLSNIGKMIIPLDKCAFYKLGSELALTIQERDF